MKTLYERLKWICLDQGMEKSRNVDIQQLIDVSSGRVTQIKQEREAARLGDVSLRLLARLGYSPDWVQEGIGNPRVSPLSDTKTETTSAESTAVEINLSEHPDLYEVPRVKFKLSAGVSGYAIEHEDGNGKPIFFRRDWFHGNGFDPARLFAVTVSGQSMETSLWDGDLVVINTADTKLYDGDVYAINYEGELVIKRLRRDAGQWFATSDNSDQRRYSPKRCTEDVKIIGKVVYKQSERI